MEETRFIRTSDVVPTWRQMREKNSTSTRVPMRLGSTQKSTEKGEGKEQGRETTAKLDASTTDGGKSENEGSTAKSWQRVPPCHNECNQRQGRTAPLHVQCHRIWTWRDLLHTYRVIGSCAGGSVSQRGFDPIAGRRLNRGTLAMRQEIALRRERRRQSDDQVRRGGRELLHVEPAILGQRFVFEPGWQAMLPRSTGEDPKRFVQDLTAALLEMH